MAGAGDGALQDLLRIMTGMKSAQEVLNACGVSLNPAAVLLTLDRVVHSALHWGDGGRHDHDWHQLLDDESGYEDGTVNFLAIPDVQIGLDWVHDIGIDLIHRRVRCLTGWTLDRLPAEHRAAVWRSYYLVWMTAQIADDRHIADGTEKVTAALRTASATAHTAGNGGHTR